MNGFTLPEYFTSIDKHSETGQILSSKLIDKCAAFGLKQFSYYVGDTAGSQIKAWKLTSKSELPFANWSLFVPDFPHCLNTAYCLGSLLLAGTKKSFEYSQCLISWLLSWTKKLIENIDDNEKKCLVFMMLIPIIK